MRFHINFSKTLFCIMLITLTTVITSSCNSSNSNNDSTIEAEESSSNAEKFEIGELGYLTDNCIGVIEKEDMNQVMKYLKADDMTGIKDLVAKGKATTFAAGKQVKIVEIGFEYIQVRDIDASEMLVWVPKNMLTHEDVYGIYK